MFGIDSNSIQIERAKNWCKNIEAANGVDPPEIIKGLLFWGLFYGCHLL